MASAAVEELVGAYIQGSWTRAPIFPENSEGDTPADGSPFVVLQYPMSNVERVTLTDPCYRETGEIQVKINVRRGDGTQTIREWGSELAALFRDKKFGSLTYGVPSEPFTNDASDEGMYFRGSMLVPYTYYFRGD